jgi:drug/metabolite transporter (DMT)-like permease
MLALTLASGTLVVRDRLTVKATVRDWATILLLGVSDGLNVIFFFAAYQRTSVAIAVLTHYLTPMLVALGAPWALGERWRTRTFVAVGISLAGLVLLLSPWSAERHSADLVGAAFGTASAVCYATTVLGSKRLVPVFSGSEMSFYHGTVSVIILAVLVARGPCSALDAHAATWLAAGAMVPGATCGLLFVWGLRRVRASIASNLTLLEPVVATLVAATFFAQPIGASGAAGGALILAGAALAVTAGSRTGT